MKVVLCIHSLQGGGAERVTASLAGRWSRAGHEVTVITQAAPATDRHALASGVKRVVLPEAAAGRGITTAVRANWRRIRSLRAALKAERPDVAVAMMSSMNVVLALAAMGTGIPRRIGCERVHPPQVPLGSVWEALRVLTYGLLQAIVVQTDLSRQWILRRTFARRVWVIPNAVSLPLSRFEPRRDPGSVGTRGRKRLLVAGRLNHQKGFDIVLEVFSRLAPAFGDWELVILGTGPLEESLAAGIDRLRLTGRALLIGEVGNMEDWYRSSELFILSSRFEGFPNVLLEAMAHGLPAVSFDCETGPRDIIRPEIDGVLVPAEDRAGLEQALRRLMEDEQLRRRLAGRAGEVVDRFSVERIDRLWEAMLTAR